MDADYISAVPVVADNPLTKGFNASGENGKEGATQVLGPRLR